MNSSFDLMLKPICGGCGTKNDLYGSNCKHLTLCGACGKSMAENRGKCRECGTVLTRLIREYNVRASSSSDKNYFIGRFATGLPNFSKKNCAENQWTLQKEGLKSRSNPENFREKFKNKPWLLEDETGQSQYHGNLEGAQSATYYLLMLQGKEFVAIPAGSWYNFNKVAQYRQLTLDEAEEKMKNRRKTVDGYERWMMKTASTGPAAFGHHPEVIKETPPAGGGKGRKKADGEADGNVSDKGEEDEGEEAARKSRLGLNKKGGEDEDDEGRRGGDFDDFDDNSDKGDDWEHEEIFTDDDEAVAIDPDEREDLLAPDVPAPPEIKADDEDEEEEDEEEEGKLSKSGKELQKLLGRSNGLDSDADDEDDGSGKRKKDDDDEDDDDEDEDRPSPVLAPKLKGPKEEPSESSPAKTAAGGSSRGTPTSKSAKGKRKSSDDAKPASGAGSKKIKTENDVKPNIKEESSKSGAASKSTPGASSSRAGASSAQAPAQGPVREEEIRAVLLQRAPLTTSELVGTFKARLKSQEDKKAFAEILKRISKIQKNNNLNYVVLRK